MNSKKSFAGFLAILLLFSLSSGCASQKQKKKNDLQEMGVRGKVKQIREYQFLAVEKFGKVEQGDSYRQEGWDLIMDFDEQGYFSKITNMDNRGNEVGHTDYIYNEQKQLIEIVNFDAEGGFSDKSMRIYDEKGRIYEIAMINSNENVSGSVLVYHNDSLQTITEEFYDRKGKLLSKEIAQLNKKGFPVESKAFDALNNLLNYRKETFNKDGLRNTLTVLSPEDAIEMALSFKYDKKGNLVLIEGTDSDGTAFLPKRYEYEFDPQGNWTKRVEYVGDKPSFWLQRLFEYYE